MNMMNKKKASKKKYYRMARPKRPSDDEIDAQINKLEDEVDLDALDFNKSDGERREVSDNLGNVDTETIAQLKKERELEIKKLEELARRREIMLATDEIEGYKFKDPKLLTLALIHSSYTSKKNESNERLEFLGDRVIGLIIASMLYKRFPDDDEGSLAIRLASLASTSSLSKIAVQMHLDEVLNLSLQERRRGGLKNKNILAAACEAVLGAIFLDGGYNAAANIVSRFIIPLMDEAKTPIKDYKTRLQEFSQRTDKSYPIYTLISREGQPHTPQFTVGCECLGQSVIAKGGSQKEAQQEAARMMVELLNVPERAVRKKKSDAEMMTAMVEDTKAIKERKATLRSTPVAEVEN